MTNLKIALLKKWTEKHKGRLTMLADGVGIKRDTLVKYMQRNSMPDSVFLLVEKQQPIIEEMEKFCIQEFPYFRRFIARGAGRISALSEYLNIPVHRLREIDKATGDGRFLMCKYGVQRIKDGMKHVEAERVKDRSIDAIKKSTVAKDYSHKKRALVDLIGIADTVKKNATAGNKSAAIVYRRMNDKQVQILTMGFDAAMDKMHASHICDPSNPHLHAPYDAILNLRKNHRKSTSEVGAIEIFCQVAPCLNCCARLLSEGVSAVYYQFEPDESGGHALLAAHAVPAFKYKSKTKQFVQVNEGEKNDL